MVQLEQVWPLPVEHLQQFMVYLYRKGLTPGTIQGKLSALAFSSKVQGYRDNSKDYRIRKMLEGWTRKRGRVQDSRSPISPALLQQLGEQWGSLCRDDYERALFKVASLIAFFGAFRVSELVAAGKEDRSGLALQQRDVLLGDNGLELFIRRSKTDQAGKGKCLVLGQCSIGGICPVRAARAYMEMRGQKEGYFLRHGDKSPLTKYQFWRLTDMALQKVGVQGLHFGTHSFRIGAASTAAALGYSPEEIRRIGRWSSASYKKYIRTLSNE